ncbi:Dimeric dUTPase, all-alpha-NTP-PPase (MazG) superfamily [Gracilibacillus ureilyticus]|uniref:Dimeric dUTPase, all-alpha-NTP-PPase (MazG) superfamily n=1 Tax=Gracilibacillus ureilyticus TaxID=531814 RepID=A0A1H9UGF7_9BACI|nr:dUTP diphosphatase [Gracilibacillus ureilyticus]SES08143.1 Dimeric dUTPase, all-alpha-NTP-PPase (MazG) superfamily [Gracilibacillus ureilyticus]
MNWQTLFHMQQDLDHYILEQHHLKNEELFEQKILALLVEVGELANETRCFKYWSLKPASQKEVILEEYVDGIHFILSIGLVLGMEDYDGEAAVPTADTTDLFLYVYEAVTVLKNERTKAAFDKLFYTYLQLGDNLGFTAEDIKDAYLEKNKINFERQNSGY